MAHTPVIELSREQLVEELMWKVGANQQDVGTGMAWALDRPGPSKPDLKSVVAVNAPAENYTDTQLRWLVLFSRRVTKDYDMRIGGYRRGANLVIIGKEREDLWLRKRLSWNMGSMYSKTMLEAMGVMLKH